MITYITAFIFYTLAMVGIMLLGFVIYKKTFVVAKNDSKGLIKVIDSYMYAPKKTLMVVKVKEEKFLIASDAATTTLIAKLSYGDETDTSSDVKLDEGSIKRLIQQMNGNSYNNQGSFENQYRMEKQKYENIEQDETRKMQSQFMDLYKNSDVSNINAAKKISAKKEVIKSLLKELNENKTQNGSLY